MLLLLLLAAGGTAWYLYNKGFTKPWREWVVEELRKRGVEVSFSKLTVEPFRGLVAKNVKVFESAERKRVFRASDRCCHGYTLRTDSVAQSREMRRVGQRWQLRPPCFEEFDLLAGFDDKVDLPCLIPYLKCDDIAY